MKLLFILENFYPKIGGVETLFYRLTTHLALQGHEVIVVTSGLPDNNRRYESLIDGLRVIRLKSPNRYYFTFFGLPTMLKYARDADLIHTTSYNAGLPASIVGLLLGKKVIITFHEYWGKMWFDLPYFSKLSLALHFTFEKILVWLPFHKYVAVSDYTARCLQENGVKPISIMRIYNGLDYEEFTLSNQGERQRRFLFYGRLGVSKGVDILLKSISLIKDKKDFEFHFILSETATPFMQTIEQIIADEGISSLVKFIPTLPFEDLKSYIQASYAVIIPSYSEGFCFAAAETMALGVPIVSSGRGALREVVSGQYVEFEEYTPVACAAAIQQAINNAWTSSPRLVFELDSTVSQYQALYRETLNLDEV